MEPHAVKGFIGLHYVHTAVIQLCAVMFLQTFNEVQHSQTLLALAGSIKPKTPVRDDGCHKGGYQLCLHERNCRELAVKGPKCR